MDKKNAVYSTVFVTWKSKDSETVLTLHDTTVEQALETAKAFGYQPVKWYRPSTWDNGYITLD